jgi:uncharacterized protein (DUF433 family)
MDKANPALTTFPLTNLSHYIETRFFGERPHLRGRRLPVATIISAARENGHGIAELAYDFTLSEAEVLAALLYYAEHKDTIDAQETAYAAVSVEDWLKYGSAALLLRRDDAPPSGK